MPGNDLDALIRDVRTFQASQALLKQMRANIRRPVPKVRRAVKARAVATLPQRGGLGRWVASSRVTAQIRLSGRAAGVRLKAGRNSQGGRSDVNRIDQGKVRAPSWGRRTAAAWHSQTVTPGWFTKPATEIDQWREIAEQAITDAVGVIRGGS